MALSQSNAAWSPCYMVINWKGVGENPSHPEWYKWCYQLCHCKASICSVAQERWTCVYAQTHSNMFYPQLLVYLYLSLWIILFHKRSCQLFLAVALVLHRSCSERWSNVGICSALWVCGALYVPADKIKEPGDESRAKRREREREGKERGCFTSLPSYRGISGCSNWLTENSSQFPSRLDGFLRRSSLASHFLGFICTAECGSAEMWHAVNIWDSTA